MFGFKSNKNREDNKPQDMIDLSKFNFESASNEDLKKAIQQAKAERLQTMGTRKAYPNRYRQAVMQEYLLRENLFIRKIDPIMGKVNNVIATAQEYQTNLDDMSDEDRLSVAKSLRQAYMLLLSIQDELMQYQNRNFDGEYIDQDTNVKQKYESLEEQTANLVSYIEKVIIIFDPQAELASEALNERMKEFIDAEDNKKAA